MNPTKISLSLIVPTIGREKDLDRLLNSLCHQTRKDFEIIVVDQSENPESVNTVLEKFTDQISIKHLVQAERGAAKARNEGALNAVGEVLAWPDDDCWYDDLAVEKALERFSSSNVSVLLGCPLTETGAPYNRWIPKTEKKVAVQDILGYGIEWAVFIRKDVFQKANGFDQRIGPGAGTVWYAGESSDLCLRIASVDKRLIYSPEVKVHHPQSRATTSDAPQKAYRYAYGMGAVCKKNNLKPIDLCLYFWTYLRSLCWALIGLRFEDLHYHRLRMTGFLQGYRNFMIDSKRQAKLGN